MPPSPAPTPTAWDRLARSARQARRRLYWAVQSRFGQVPESIRQSASEWDADYAAGNWEGLDSITEVAHYMLILGYLDYAVQPARLLDVGCGHGRLLRLLARFGFGGYLGVDISSEAVERARALSVPGTRFEVVDMNRWDTGERFDAVLFNESLYYAQDPRRVFERAVGWLAEDGIVIVSTFRQSPGSRKIWSAVESVVTEPLAGCSVTDDATGYTWDVRVMRRPQA